MRRRSWSQSLVGLQPRQSRLKACALRILLPRAVFCSSLHPAVPCSKQYELKLFESDTLLRNGTYEASSWSQVRALSVLRLNFGGGLYDKQTPSFVTSLRSKTIGQRTRQMRLGSGALQSYRIAVPTAFAMIRGRHCRYIQTVLSRCFLNMR